MAVSAASRNPMNRGTASLTREEVSRILQFPPGVVDALIDEGLLLCHVRNDQARVPVEQLEAFFRDGLVRLYRAEAQLDGGRDAAFQFTTATPEPRPDVAREPEPSRPEPEPVEPAQVAEPSGQQGGDSAAAPEPSPDSRVMPSPRQFEPVSSRDAYAVEDDDDDREQVIDKPDLRHAPRFIPRRQIDGIFHDVKFTIVQLSSTGLRIRHDQPLIPGDEAKVSFALLHPPRSFVMRARVVWTSVAHYEQNADRTFCISGIRIIDHVDRLARAIEILRSSHDLQPERRAEPRKGAPVETMTLDGVSDDEVAIVMGAVQKFAADPVEANRWYGRAKFALADPQVRREAPERPRDREEVLGLWEYLERNVEIAKIACVLTWMRKTRAGAGAGGV